MGQMTNLCSNLIWCPYKNNPTIFCGIWPSPVFFCFVLICFCVFFFQGETRLDKSQAPFYWHQNHNKKERVGEGQGQWLKKTEGVLSSENGSLVLAQL